MPTFSGYSVTRMWSARFVIREADSLAAVIIGGLHLTLSVIKIKSAPLRWSVPTSLALMWSPLVADC